MSPDYQKALEKFGQLARNTDWFSQFNILALALQENLDQERLFGPTEQTRHDRFRLVHQFDQLASAHQMNTTFSDLCMDSSSFRPKLAEDTPSSGIYLFNQEQVKGGDPQKVSPLLHGKGSRWAVLVGVNKYEDTLHFKRLQVCVQDAISLQNQLVAGGFNEQQIHLLTDKSRQQPLRENILAALQSMANATEPGDLLLFYFSGHGMAEQGESYLIARKSKGVALRDTAIPIERIKSIIKSAKASAKVIVIDACHSGANIAQAKGKRPMSEEFIHSVFREAEGLAIISSCQAGQYSYEWPEKKCSVFTYYFIEALQGKADDDSKNFVTVQDVNRYITYGVKRWAAQQQVKQSPTLNYLVTGDIILANYAPHKPGDTPPSTDAISEQLPLSEETIKENSDQYIGRLEALREGQIHQELTKELEREHGIKPMSRSRPAEDILERYRRVPLHALFLYTSEDSEIEAYITNHWGELDALSGDICDIHPSVAQFKQPQDENAYTFMDDFTILRDAHFDAYAQLPGVFFWDLQQATEYVSFGNKPDVVAIRNMLRLLFNEIRREPTIAAVARAKRRLELAKLQGGLDTVSSSSANHQDDFQTLYQILADYTSDLDLKEICQAVRVNYNRLSGDSHAERAFSLTKNLRNQDRLIDLEKELRKRLPRRIPPDA